MLPFPMLRVRQFLPAPQPLRETPVHSASPRCLLRALSILASRLQTALSARVRINIIPKPLAFLCFHTLTHSFALRKTLSAVVSTSSTPFAQNTGGGVYPSPPSLVLPHTSPAYSQQHAQPVFSHGVTSYFSGYPRGEGLCPTRQFDRAVRPANTASGRPAAAESFFAAPPPEGALSPAFAPAAPISSARRTPLIGASSFNTTVPPFASTPNCFHIGSKSTCIGVSFHTAYNFSSTSTPVALSPISKAFSIVQSSLMFPPASRIPRSASSNPFLLLVCFRICTSATKPKSAPPQYVRPHVCVWSIPWSPACGSPLGMSRTRSLHICCAVQCPARIRAMGSTYT